MPFFGQELLLQAEKKGTADVARVSPGARDVPDAAREHRGSMR